MSWSAGSRVDDYELVEQLGAGGMGAVFLARHLPTGGLRALKTLAPGVPHEQLLRFRREAEAQAKVDAHPNVVRIHSMGQAEGRPYLVMDYAPGGDLAQRLSQGPLAPAEAVRLVEQLARGMAHAHRHGVLHRDLKPANVVFGDDGTPRLVDFGLARIAGGEALTQTGEVFGTPAYMAPEQALGKTADERTDVYGLGAILYAALTAELPHEGKGLALLQRVAHEDPVPPSRWVTLPASVEQACLRAMARDPDRRPQTAEALAEFLADVSLEPERSGSPWLIASAALLVCALAVAILWPPPEAPSETPAETQPSVPQPQGPLRSVVIANPEWLDPDGPLPELDLPPLPAPPSAETYQRLKPEGRQLLAHLQTAPDDVEAMFEMGATLRANMGSSGPHEPTLYWYMQGLLQGHRSGPVEVGLIFRHHRTARDLDLAARLFVWGARKHNDARCMYGIAEMLYWAEGLVCDPALARRWLERALLTGDLHGQQRALLGELLLTGRGGPKDVDRAERLLRQSVAVPFPDWSGYIWLARLQPKEERIEFLRAAIRRHRMRHPGVLSLLGDLLSDRGELRLADDAYRTGRRGHPTHLRHHVYLRLADAQRHDTIRADHWAADEDWLELAAEDGNPTALLRLARAEQDPARARAMVLRAARQGDPQAMERYAEVLGEGAEADAWLERARLRRLGWNEQR